MTYYYLYLLNCRLNLACLQQCNQFKQQYIVSFVWFLGIWVDTPYHTPHYLKNYIKMDYLVSIKQTGMKNLNFCDGVSTDCTADTHNRP